MILGDERPNSMSAVALLRLGRLELEYFWHISGIEKKPIGRTNSADEGDERSAISTSHLLIVIRVPHHDGATAVVCYTM